MKKEEKTQLTRQKILEAALREFGANGYGGGTINNICATGIAKGLLYHNFKSKDELYLACVTRCFADLSEALETARPEEKAAPSPSGEIERYMQARLRFFAAREREAHLFFEAILQPPEALRAEIAACRAPLDAVNRQLYEGLLAGLPLRRDVSERDALTYFQTMQTMFNGYFSSEAQPGQPFAARMAAHEAALPKLLDFMLYGIAERRE